MSEQTKQHQRVTLSQPPEVMQRLFQTLFNPSEAAFLFSSVARTANEYEDSSAGPADQAATPEMKEAAWSVMGKILMSLPEGHRNACIASLKEASGGKFDISLMGHQ